jgi:esterase
MELFFQRMGSGPPFVILHGLYGSSDNWVSIAKMLSGRFEVWLIDQRNHGRSPHSEVHSYEAMREDLLEFFDRHGIAKAVVLGHSMGGKTAMFFATAFPDRVTALVVVDIAPKSYRLHRDPLLGYTDHQHILAGLQQIDLGQATTREEVETQLKQHVPSGQVVGFLMKNLHRKGDRQFEWRIHVRAIAENMDHILGGLEPADFALGRGVTGFPVLFLRGARSGYIQPEDIIPIRTIFPAAEIVTIPDAGHWLHAEKPNLLIRNIEHLLGD